MSYTPTEWECGDTITAAKMNKIEQGIADASNNGGVLIVHTAQQTVGDSLFLVMDKTMSELLEAYEAGKTIIVEEPDLTGMNDGVAIRLYVSKLHIANNYGYALAVTFNGSDTAESSAPYYNDATEVVSASYDNDGLGHSSFSPYLSRWYGTQYNDN